jgi:hypothetical protein
VSDDPVYESDPLAAPDDEFEPGEPAHLVPGNRGRMLDPRRTPIVVTRLLPDVAMFELEVAAFEDAGARWEIEVERVGNFQFEPGQARADAAVVSTLDEAARRFDRHTHISCREEDRATTLARIDAERRRARTFLPGGRDPFDALEAYMAELGLAAMEEAFAERSVSNAASGELVKGHAIVLAQLGLCPYDGKIQRDPDLFAGDRSEERRSQHIVARLAFVRELFALEGVEHVTLYRGLATDAPLQLPRLRSFVSATFDRHVAEAHFAGGATTVAAALYRQSVPVDRLFMTYRETRAMNQQFRESEAVLIGDPNSPLF